MKKHITLQYYWRGTKGVMLSLLFLSLLIANSNVFGQISEGGIPPSFDKQLTQEVPTVQMPDVNEDSLLQLDAAQYKNGVPYRFGYPIEVDLDMNNSGIWEELPGGGKVWRLEISSPGAYSINLVYDWYDVPEGAEFFVYNSDKSKVLGAFTHRNNKEHSKFATGVVPGDKIILEYYEPSNVESQSIISISHVVHAYKDVFAAIDDKGYGDSGDCNNNVNCPVGEDWQNEKRSVGMILTANNSRICTGSLVNNVQQDQTPYFLTANHCLGGEETWIFMFNYESPDCEDQDGLTNYTVQGSDLLANNSASDFALLEINEAIPDSYRVHYAGWSAIDTTADNTTAIHHPSGDIKKISFDYDPTISDDYIGDGVPNSHWQVEDWDDGTTEPGSSGSPLFDQNHRIIGQLHGGYAACGNDDADWYGKVAYSWDYGSSESTRLKDWLDPDDTGTLVLDGWDPTMGDTDYVAPSTITDLVVDDTTSNTLVIKWTAPFDTSFSGVKDYDIRFSESMINDTSDFNSATEVDASISPADSGETEMLVINNLNFSTKYYFAIRSSDMWGNVSQLSNIAEGMTYAVPSMEVSPLSIETAAQQGSQIMKDINVANVSDSSSTLDFSYNLTNNTFPENSVTINLKPNHQDAVDKESSKINPVETNGVALKGFGGPDTFGYEWIDSYEDNGPEYQWNNISSSGTQASDWTATGTTFDAMDEGYAGPFNIGFNFKFYGQEYNQVYVGSNGLVSFGAFNDNNFSNDPIPDQETPNNIIAAIWDDLDGSSGGEVYYQQMNNKFVIQYNNWGEYFDSGTFTCQIVLHSSGKINIYYESMTGDLTSTTVGIENANGTDGLQVVNDAAYIEDGLALEFSAKPEWLVASAPSGLIYNGNSVDIELEFLTEDIPLGEYSMDVVINSNDPDNPEVTVPVTMYLGVNNWTAEIDVSNSTKGKATKTLTFGQHPLASDGIDTSLGEAALSNLTPFESYFGMPTGENSYADIRGSVGEELTWDLHLDADPGDFPVEFTWDNDSLPNGSFKLSDTSDGSMVYADMRSDSSLTLSNSDIDILQINYIKLHTMILSVNSGWNIVSAPMNMEDMTPSGVFPSASSEPFAFEGSYVVPYTLEMTEGYWLKFDSSETVTMMGQEITGGGIDVTTGWNIVGPYSQEVMVEDLTTTPSGIISSQLYGFEETYQVVESLKPGKGVWVKVSQDGTINLGGGGKSRKITLPTVQKDWTKLKVVDYEGNVNHLYLSEDKSSLSAFELPPRPPEGTKDVRFSSDRYVESKSKGSVEMELNSLNYPVQLSVEGENVRIEDAFNGKMVNSTLREGEQIEISNDNVNKLLVQTMEVPVKYQLSQNYPNPFNPTTNIEFGIPESGEVKLAVYNVLGEKVSELVNRQMESGYHEVEFNAGNLSSGIYIYKLEAGEFSKVRKMILMK